MAGGGLVIFALSGLYQKWWRYFGRRDYETVLRAVVLLTIALAAYIAIVHPVKVSTRGGGEIAVSAPAGVIALFFLLTLAFTLRRAAAHQRGAGAAGARLPAHSAEHATC